MPDEIRRAPPRSTPPLVFRDAGTIGRHGERLAVIGVAVTLTVLRSAVLVAFEGAQFDSDQALIGLMAKHLIEGRAFPVFTYGQPYMLGVEAWLAAPFFLIGGVTVPMLKAPLLLINVATSVGLVLLVERAAGLRPALALVPALFFILAPPGTTALFLEASGGNVEPFLYVLLIWIVRRVPLLAGGVLAFGVLHREFTIYALGALLMLALADRSLWQRARIRASLVGGVGFAAVWQVVYVLKQFSSIDGPGTSARWGAADAGANVGAVARHFCFDPLAVPGGMATLASAHLPELFGAIERPLVSYGINSTLHQGSDWLWMPLGGAFVVALVRVVWSLARAGARWKARSPEFALYLGLVGLQALAVYTLFRCGVIHVGTMRYSLLGVLGAVGLMTAFLQLETRRWLKAVVLAIVVLWACASAADHARLAGEYLHRRPPDARRALADHLVERGIRFGRADFWDAYSTVFLSGERVIIASTTVSFIREYQWLVEQGAAGAVEIRREPCPGGTAIEGWLYVCGAEPEPVPAPPDGQPPS